MESVTEDCHTLISHLKDVDKKVELTKKHVSLVRDHILSPEFDTKCGIDLLELKNQLLLSYVISLNYVMLMKCEGSEDPDHMALDRLVEIRTVVEKIRPLEHRFSYQLDKLLKMASDKDTGGDHPLQFKPVPGNLVPKVASKAMSDDSIAGDSETSGLYIPPRVLAVPYHEDKRGSGSLLVPRSQHNQLISELRDELTDFPMETLTFDEDFRKKKGSEDKVRENYEEEHMMRLRNRNKSRDHSRVGQEQLEQLTDFSLFKDLSGQGGISKGGRKRRKKNSSVKRK